MAADLQRVHDWNYLAHLQSKCERLQHNQNSGTKVAPTAGPSANAALAEGAPDCMLDSDTRLSAGSWQAALAAAGAAIGAVDHVSISLPLPKDL